MKDWKNSIIKKARKGSQTPGNKKGESCQADFLKKYYAKSSRSRKDPGYDGWCKRMDGLNGIKR